MQVSYKLASAQAQGQEYSDVEAYDQRSSTYNYLLWTVLALGIFLRLYHYFDNRSLWIDEIYLSTSLLKYNFIELATASLDYQQKAPIGFLWLVKITTLLFGDGEKSLRFIPLLSGIGSLIFFLPVARTLLKPLGAVLAMTILAFAPPIVYHAVEMKQYSVELFTTVMVLYLYTRYEGKMDLKSLISWGLWGALIIWFSFTSIFILAGMAIGVCLYYLVKKNWYALFRSIIPFSIWLVSFATNFLLFTAKHTDAEWLVSWFRTRGGFMPLGQSVMGAVVWVLQAVYRLFDYPLNVLWNAEFLQTLDSRAMQILLKMPLFIFLFAGIGLFYFLRRDPKLFLVLLLPLLLTLGASLVDKYPFYERLLTFIAPLPILYLAQGCERLIHKLPGGWWRYGFVVILVGWPIISSARQAINTNLFWDYKKSLYREALLHMNEQYREGDVVYVYWNFKPAFRFYKQTYNLKPEGKELSDVRLISSSPEDYVRRLKPEFSDTTGVKRIWFVYERFLMLEIGDYDHEPEWYLKDGIEGGELLKKEFSRMGTEVSTFTGPNVGVTLYDLNK